MAEPKRPVRRLARKAPRIKALAVPNARDILRGEPNLIQGAAAGVVGALKRAMGDYNNQRVDAGLRPIDYPGRRGSPKRMVTPRRGLKGPFKPGVRLDPSHVHDQRANTMTEVRAARPPVRGGVSSNTPGPRPQPRPQPSPRASARARSVANPNARFLRGSAAPTQRIARNPLDKRRRSMVVSR